MFKRQDTIRICGLTSNELQSLERRGLVNPDRKIKKKKPEVFYSWDDLIKLKFISLLGELKSSKKILNLLNCFLNNTSAPNKRILYLNEEVFFINSNLSDLGKIIKTKGAGEHEILILPSYIEVEKSLKDFL